ncbi:MAG: polysaccharide deacetylase family protein [Bacillota bacterium]|nr:polysaccharide deacetylase family protein [Bacillota bacterium]
MTGKKLILALVLVLALNLVMPGTAGAAEPEVTYTPVGIPVLMYHQLAPRPVSICARHNVLVTPEVFERQMQYLEENGYTTITCRQLAAYLHEGEALPPRPVLITFDDGWRSSFLHAFPVLKRHRMKATVFLITAMVGKVENLNDPVQAVAGLGAYLSWDEVSEMAESGLVRFESHTHNLHFADKRRRAGMDVVSREYLLEDLQESIRLIEHATGYRPVALAYPYGHYRKSYKDSLEKAGIRLGFTTRSGEAHFGDDPYALRRVTIYPFHNDLGRVLRVTRPVMPRSIRW